MGGGNCGVGRKPTSQSRDVGRPALWGKADMGHPRVERSTCTPRTAGARSTILAWPTHLEFCLMLYFRYLEPSPKVTGIEAEHPGSILRVISHRVKNAENDVNELRVVLVELLDLLISRGRDDKMFANFVCYRAHVPTQTS